MITTSQENPFEELVSYLKAKNKEKVKKFQKPINDFLIKTFTKSRRTGWLEFVAEKLEEALELYCYENGLQVNVKSIVHEFLTNYARRRHFTSAHG